MLSPHLSLSFCYPLLHAWACVVPALSFCYPLLHAWACVVPALSFCYPLLHAWACVVPALSFCYPLLHAWACVVPALSFCYPLLHAWACVVPALIIDFLLSPTSCMSMCCPHTYHSVPAIPYFMHELVFLPVKSLRCVLFCYWPCGVSYPIIDLVMCPILLLTLWCIISY